MNFLPAGRRAGYVVTGTWGEKAIAEARLLGEARVAATTEQPGGGYTRVPDLQGIDVDPKDAYLHLTSNNTIYGTQFHAPAGHEATCPWW